MPLIEPMRDVIGRAIYDESNGLASDYASSGSHSWYNLSEERREPWRRDADRVIDALKVFAYDFGEYAYEHSGADWLAMSPPKLWRDFLEYIQKTNGPLRGPEGQS